MLPWTGELRPLPVDRFQVIGLGCWQGAAALSTWFASPA
jgi:predicted naringenin-chalcone synthase